MKLEARDAFGMVVIPRKALDATEKARHRQFCELLLASLDFVAPEDVTPTEVLATYWPTVSSIDPASIRMAFATQDCPSLLLWYDHKLARDIAARTGVQDKSGPLLVTWPSQRTVAKEERDPLVVDFSRANAVNARRTLAYWFRQVSQDPTLWTDHIREGTFRADLADVSPGLVLCSPLSRARETARLAGLQPDDLNSRWALRSRQLARSAFYLQPVEQREAAAA